MEIKTPKKLNSSQIIETIVIGSYKQAKDKRRIDQKTTLKIIKGLYKGRPIIEVAGNSVVDGITVQEWDKQRQRKVPDP